MALIDSQLLFQFSSNLKRLRVKADLSQEALALRSGLDRTYISGCERGVRNPTVTTIEKIARALDIPVAKLFEEEA